MKQVSADLRFPVIGVVPYIGTWIETKEILCSESDIAVVPYIGTWIETLMVYKLSDGLSVVPYIGTWIETSVPPADVAGPMSYLI